jgi:hypothetical protein
MTNLAVTLSSDAIAQFTKQCADSTAIGVRLEFNKQHKLVSELVYDYHAQAEPYLYQYPSFALIIGSTVARILSSKTTKVIINAFGEPDLWIEISEKRTYTKPQKVFDPNDQQHRRWLGEFVKTQSWRDCPVRLTVRGYGNTVAAMQRQLLEWYFEQEKKCEAVE